MTRAAATTRRSTASVRGVRLSIALEDRDDGPGT